MGSLEHPTLPSNDVSAKTTSMAEQFEVFVSKDSFKFNAAHFIAYKGFRERLHGHNYRVSVRITGQIGADGYVVDFGDIKAAARAICGQWNERIIIPRISDCLDVNVSDGQVAVVCEDGSRFSFPEQDCVFLDIIHSSAEELARLLCQELCNRIEALAARDVRTIEVGVAETPMQEARFTMDVA